MRSKIKKFCFPLTISLLAAAVILLIIYIFGVRTRDQEPPTLRIGVAVYSQEDTFIGYLVQSLERMAREREAGENLRINVSTMDGKSSQLIQNEQVQRFIALNYDVLCVNIVDRTAAAYLIDMAADAEIPILFFNRQPVAEDLQRWESAYYIGAPAEQSGSLQGKIVLDLWENEQERVDKNGDGILQYVILEGEPGHQDTLIRTESCIQVLTNAGVRVEKLASDTANWNRSQAAAKMSQWQEKFGEAIEVVFSNNDDMALGAIDSLQEAGVTTQQYPIIVGVDATAPAQEAVRAGTMSGTVLNDGDGIAKAMLDLSLLLYHGEIPEQKLEIEEGHYIWLDYRQVTKAQLEGE